MKCLIHDLPVYYEDYGKGTPIICLHGYTLDHRMMSGCLEPIFSRPEYSDLYRRIYLDLPGMGQTPAAKWIKNADNVLDILTEFINIIIPDENFLIAGESFGAYLSLGLIHNMKDKINGALLICPQIKSWIMNRIEKEKLPGKKLLFMSADMPSANDDPDVNEYLSFAVIATPHNLNRTKADILAGIKIADNDFLFNYFDGAYSHDFEASLRVMEFDKPSLIFTGRQDNAVGFLDAFDLFKRFSRATFVAADGGGHNAHIECETVLSPMVMDWITRLEREK